jgi:hypothetical protein
MSQLSDLLEVTSEKSGIQRPFGNTYRTAFFGGGHGKRASCDRTKISSRCIRVCHVALAECGAN